MTMDGTMDAADEVRILTPYWEKAGAFERGPETGATWSVRSWGPSRTADRLASILGAARDGGDHRVYLLDETAHDDGWEWAHAVVRACQEAAARPGPGCGSSPGPACAARAATG